jgi:hypothetical protein
MRTNLWVPICRSIRRREKQEYMSTSNKIIQDPTKIKETSGTACATTCTCQTRHVHRARTCRHRRVHSARTRRRGRVHEPADMCGHATHSQHAPDLTRAICPHARTQPCALLCARALPGVSCCFFDHELRSTGTSTSTSKSIYLCEQTCGCRFAFPHVGMKSRNTLVLVLERTL